MPSRRISAPLLRPASTNPAEPVKNVIPIVGPVHAVVAHLREQQDAAGPGANADKHERGVGHQDRLPSVSQLHDAPQSRGGYPKLSAANAAHYPNHIAVCHS